MSNMLAESGAIKKGDWQCSERNIGNKLFCWPKGFCSFEQTGEEVFTVFLLSTVIEHHAGNVAVLCTRHFCSCLSFIIHCSYESVKRLLVANNNLLTRFHTLALILSPLVDPGSVVYSKIASASRCARSESFYVASPWRCLVPLKRSHPLSMSWYTSSNSQLRDKPTGQNVLLFIWPLCCHCAAVNPECTVVLQSKAKSLIWRVAVVATLQSACKPEITEKLFSTREKNVTL